MLCATITTWRAPCRDDRPILAATCGANVSIDANGGP